MLAIFILNLIVTIKFSESANILLLPAGNASHFLEIDGVGRPLLQRGHKIYVIHDDQTTLPTGNRYESLIFANPDSLVLKLDAKMQQKLVENPQAANNISFLLNITKSSCLRLLNDQKLFAKLATLNLDLAIIDSVFVPCFYLVPYNLGIPWIGISSLLTAWQARLPVLPSVVQPPLGLEMFGVQFCEETDNQWLFIRRVCRLFAHILNEAFPLLFDTDYLHEYANFTSMQELREKTALYLINHNHLLSSPLPKLPNVEFVGGITTKPAAPLEPNLESWMQVARNVIVVSFGSNLGSLPASTTQKLLDAFSKMPSYRFIWRYALKESLSYQIPANVRLMDWLPQNDLLGHNSTLAFVTHSGNNGQQEALYHGIPMLCFYVSGDQKNNAKRVVKRGYGIMIDIHNFTASDLVFKLTDLIENEKYRQQVKKASAIFHSEKHPSERAADAVENVLKYGSDHLMPKEALKLNVFQYYMLDVFAIIYLLALFIIVISFKCMRCTLSRCFCRGQNEPPKLKAE